MDLFSSPRSLGYVAAIPRCIFPPGEAGLSTAAWALTTRQDASQSEYSPCGALGAEVGVEYEQ